MTEQRTRRNPITEEELAFIRTYSTGPNKMKDKEIAEALGGSVAWVRKQRQKHGISKNDKTNQKKLEQNIAQRIDNGDINAINDIKVTAEDKIKDIFKNLFKNTVHYEMLQNMFSKEEIRYYLEEFSALVSEVKSQGGTLTSSEFRNLDQWIQLSIRRNRLLSEEKRVKDMIDRLLAPVDGDLSEAEDETRTQVFTLQTTIRDVSRNLKDITEQSIKVQSELEMTRKERLKRMTDSEKGILNIIQTMQDDQKRAQIDRQAAMLAEAQKKIEKSWKKDGLIVTSETKEESNGSS